MGVQRNRVQLRLSSSETYELTTGIARQLGGAYGPGNTYAKTMFGAAESH